MTVAFRFLVVWLTIGRNSIFALFVLSVSNHEQFSNISVMLLLFQQGSSDPAMFAASKISRATELKAPFLQCEKYFHTITLTDLHGKFVCICSSVCQKTATRVFSAHHIMTLILLSLFEIAGYSRNYSSNRK